MEFALRHGMCLLDDDDWGKVNGWIWHSRLSVRRKGGERIGTPYTVGYPLGGSAEDELEMHRLILGMPRYRDDPRDVDHLNGNGLDNRRFNLRVATRSQNLANTASHRDAASRFKGVSRGRRPGRWRAQIAVNGRYKGLGEHATEEQAALAYNIAAAEAWGEYARLNVIPATVTLQVARGSSLFRGVSWDKQHKRWAAQITAGGRHRLLGRFATEEEAALAYNAAALAALGDRAKLNIIPETHA